MLQGRVGKYDWGDGGGAIERRHSVDVEGHDLANPRLFVACHVAVAWLPIAANEGLDTLGVGVVEPSLIGFFGHFEPIAQRRAIYGVFKGHSHSSILPSLYFHSFMFKFDLFFFVSRDYR
jgi:hypothetical protein